MGSESAARDPHRRRQDPDAFAEGLNHLKLLPEERVDRVRDRHSFPRSEGARCRVGTRAP
jgi:hypothetical protein